MRSAAKGEATREPNTCFVNAAHLKHGCTVPKHSVREHRRREVGQPLLRCCQLNVGSEEGRGDARQKPRG